MDTVLITKWIDGVESKIEVKYSPKKESRIKGDCIKRLSSKKKKKVKRSKSKGFYSSSDWLQLRYRVLKTYQAKCMCCGRSPWKHGIVVHVDHIKPRSKYPELELEFNNMQVLCASCNIGKSNIDNTDWRLSSNDLAIIKEFDKFN